MSYVYFLEAECEGRPVKIGLSKDPVRKLSFFETSSPVPVRYVLVMPGGSSLLKTLHSRFASTQMHGHWFKMSPDIESYIEEQSHVSAAVAEKADRSGWPLLSVGSAAQLLGVSRDEIDRLCREGLLKPVYTSGGHRRFNQDALLDYRGITFT